MYTEANTSLSLAAWLLDRRKLSIAIQYYTYITVAKRVYQIRVTTD